MKDWLCERCYNYKYKSYDEADIHTNDVNIFYKKILKLMKLTRGSNHRT